MIAYILRSIKAINDATHDKYFLTWFIPLVIFAVIITAGLFDLFGFDKTFKIAHQYTIHCRNLTDKEALAMLLCVFISAFTCILVIGELINFAENRKQNRPINHFSFMLSTCVCMIAVSTTYVLSHKWCA
ncbi:hypothetical protein ACO0LE_09540 [Undibacterium sp. Xuan67W]